MRFPRMLSGLAVSAMSAAFVVLPAATPVSAATTRWVAVSVATLWTRPGIDRPVDAPAVARPADPARWVAAMSVDQKRWLVGHLETQALYGTRVLVLDTTRDSRGRTWSKVVVPNQPTPRDSRGYPGWVPSRQLSASAPATTSSYAVVKTRQEWLYSSVATVGTTSGELLRLSYGTRLPVVSVTATAVEVVMLDGRHRALGRSDAAVRRSGSSSVGTRSGVVAAARKMVGLGYLWAGTSGFGYDCSGLTYSVFGVAGGIRIGRDADEQARHGTPVAYGALQPGDLVFYAGSSRAVTHVALYIGAVDGTRSMLEAPATGLRVRIVPLRSARFAGARRYPLH